MAREQKKDTEQVYDKNAFATVDIGEKHYTCTVQFLKTLKNVITRCIYTKSKYTFPYLK